MRGWVAVRRVLGIRDFRVVLGAGLVSLTGDWLLGVGMAYYVYRLTGSTMAAVGMLAASSVPAILVGPVAGVYVDRWDRRRTMIVTNLLMLAGLLPLLLVGSPGRVWIAYAVVAFETTVEQFFDPARGALLPALVAPDLRLAANALNGQTRDLARLVGAGLGGIAGAVTTLAGTLAAGWLGDRYGIVPVFSLQGCCLLVAGAVAVVALHRRPVEVAEAAVEVG